MLTETGSSETKRYKRALSILLQRFLAGCTAVKMYLSEYFLNYTVIHELYNGCVITITVFMSYYQERNN